MLLAMVIVGGVVALVLYIESAVLLGRGLQRLSDHYQRPVVSYADVTPLTPDQVNAILGLTAGAESRRKEGHS